MGGASGYQHTRTRLLEKLRSDWPEVGRGAGLVPRSVRRCCSAKPRANGAARAASLNKHRSFLQSSGLGLVQARYRGSHEAARGRNIDKYCAARVCRLRSGPGWTVIHRLVRLLSLVNVLELH
ncbi:hypothetical protein AOLI_G00064230 [Acnodon oligacanthus]